MIIRTIRDIFTGDVDAIYIDEPGAYERAKEFLQIVMPRYVNRCSSTKARSRCFTSTSWTMKSPASINGRSRCAAAARWSSIRPRRSWRSTSTAAASAPTARPRNRLSAQSDRREGNRPAVAAARLGWRRGQRLYRHAQRTHRRTVEKTLRDAVKRDRARTKILRTSPFGLIEMTRQRIRPSLKRSVYKECPGCTGSGLVKSAESMAIEVIRKLIMCRPERSDCQDFGDRRRRGRHLSEQPQAAKSHAA